MALLQTQLRWIYWDQNKQGLQGLEVGRTSWFYFIFTTLEIVRITFTMFMLEIIRLQNIKEKKLIQSDPPLPLGNMK